MGELKSSLPSLRDCFPEFPEASPRSRDRLQSAHHKPEKTTLDLILGPSFSPINVANPTSQPLRTSLPSIFDSQGNFGNNNSSLAQLTAIKRQEQLDTHPPKPPLPSSSVVAKNSSRVDLSQLLPAFSSHQPPQIALHSAVSINSCRQSTKSPSPSPPSRPGSRPYRCVWRTNQTVDCFHTFSTKDAMQAHFRTHFGLVAYPCPHPNCEKGFPTPDKLTVHMRSHTGEKPFNCQVCDRGFSEKGTLVRHMKTHGLGKKGK